QMEVGLSQSMELLSSQAGRLMDQMEQIGEAIPHGTPLGDAMLTLMDIVIEMDSASKNAQLALAYCCSTAVRGRRATRREEQEELLQARRDRRSWEQKQQAMEKQLSDSQLKVKNLQELNNMLMERARRATTPSSGYCSASHSPRSMEGENSATPPKEAAAAVEKKEEKKKEESVSVPPPKPERRPKTQTLDYTPDFSSATFKDSIQLHPRKQLSPVPDLDGTITLSDSPEMPNEGPLCSTFREERSVYHTPVTSKKNVRRRSSSLSDVMKKIFTPKQVKRVKNPILEVMD
ncbi:hypothetical protein PENTCL1PPCAC_7440, partial [Pristionchus entomophagus]